MRLLLYIAIGILLWRIVRALMRPPTPPPSLREPPRNERVEERRGVDIDYSRVRDAEWREGDPPRGTEGDARRE